MILEWKQTSKQTNKNTLEIIIYNHEHLTSADIKDRKVECFIKNSRFQSTHDDHLAWEGKGAKEIFKIVNGFSSTCLDVPVLNSALKPALKTAF